MSIPGVEVAGRVVNDMVKTLANAIGFKSIKKRENVSTKCKSCGNQISGVKGEFGKCEYCGIKVKL